MNQEEEILALKEKVAELQHDILICQSFITLWLKWNTLMKEKKNAKD